MSAARWIWPGTTVVRVVDGDTFDAQVARDLGFYGEAAFRVRFRLQRINAPKRSSAAGARAGARLAELLAAPFTLESGKPYKYGGEWMAEVTLPDGRNASDVLVAEGHAVYWDGTGPRPGESG